MITTAVSASHGVWSLRFATVGPHGPGASTFEGCKVEHWRICRGLSGKLSVISVGRQLHHDRTYMRSAFGWHAGKGWPLDQRAQRSQIVAAAIPTPVTAAGIALVVGVAVFALINLNKNNASGVGAKKACEVCGGSGICPTCNGQGFVNKALSEEAAARARARAKDAATRNTAGLPRKWNYCSDCSGQRGCRNCAGRGWIA